MYAPCTIGGLVRFEMTVTLPCDQLAEIVLECGKWKTKHTASCKQIQSIAGKVQHVTKCVKPASRFTNCVLAVMQEIPFRGQHHFSDDLLLDLAWFETFSHLYNGIQLLPPPSRTSWVIECDSNLHGGGAFSPTHF